LAEGLEKSELQKGFVRNGKREIEPGLLNGFLKEWTIERAKSRRQKPDHRELFERM
jgi:hypothetical protein